MQIGVTVATMMSAAFGADTLAKDLVPVVTGWGCPRPPRPRSRWCS
ncbi:hypothetical protein ACFQX6_34070 [Streptosporangium lutulentum]